MKKKLFVITSTIIYSILFFACNNNNQPQTTGGSSANPKDWKFGVALWTFHTVNFPESLKMVDSVGVRYIEPNTFHKAGPELNDSLVGDLSPAGVEKLKQMAKAHNLIIGSLYVSGGKTLDSWIKGFNMAKQLGVPYITA